jgi:ribosomal-protein-serine acetyltransferase
VARRGFLLICGDARRLTASPGVVLKLFEPGEAEAILAVVERNRGYLRQGLPWLYETRTAAGIAQFIGRAEAQCAGQRGPKAGIWRDGAFVGSVGCHPIDHANRHCRIGHGSTRSTRGKGLITRCTIALPDYLFNELRLHGVTVYCDTGNTRSCAIPQRLGFTREGAMREAEWVGGAVGWTGWSGRTWSTIGVHSDRHARASTRATDGQRPRAPSRAWRRMRFAR